MTGKSGWMDGGRQGIHHTGGIRAIGEESPVKTVRTRQYVPGMVVLVITLSLHQVQAVESTAYQEYMIG